MVVRTFTENGKTIRVWQESRGNKTLTRKFYLRYRLITEYKGEIDGSMVFDTISDASNAQRKFMDRVKAEQANNIFFYKWIEDSNQTSTHVNDTAFKCGCAWSYIQEDAGDRISEIIE